MCRAIVRTKASGDPPGRLHAYLVARAGTAHTQFDLDAIKANGTPTTMGVEPKGNQTVWWISTVGSHFWPKQAALPSLELDYVVSKLLELADAHHHSLFGVAVQIGPFGVDITDDRPPGHGFLRRWLRAGITQTLGALSAEQDIRTEFVVIQKGLRDLILASAVGSNPGP